jgi:hypothetical protein
MASGPFNLQQGNTAKITVKCFDANNRPTGVTVPTLTVKYTNTANSSQTDTVTLFETQTYFVGVWSSTSAALGLATWSTTTSSGMVLSNGQFRVIARMAL